MTTVTVVCELGLQNMP